MRRRAFIGMLLAAPAAVLAVVRGVPDWSREMTATIPLETNGDQLTEESLDRAFQQLWDQGGRGKVVRWRNTLDDMQLLEVSLVKHPAPGCELDPAFLLRTG
jgi:hypothetical protein